MFAHGQCSVCRRPGFPQGAHLLLQSAAMACPSGYTTRDSLVSSLPPFRRFGVLTFRRFLVPHSALRTHHSALCLPPAQHSGLGPQHSPSPGGQGQAGAEHGVQDPDEVADPRQFSRDSPALDVPPAAAGGMSRPEERGVSKQGAQSWFSLDSWRSISPAPLSFIL